MLHIIGLILKIIGIILVSILGLLVLLLCIVLFVPICYQIKGRYDNTLDSLQIEMKVNWLLHLIAGCVIYEDATLSWRIRALWFRKSSQTAPPTEQFQKRSKEEPKVLQRDELKESQKIQKEEEEQTGRIQPKVADETGRIQLEMTEEKDRNCKDDADTMDLADYMYGNPRKKKKTLWKRICQIKVKIISVLHKIKYTFKQFCDNIRLMLQKKEHVQDFFTAEDHIHTLNKGKEQLVYLLKRWKPGKCIIHGEVGFEDPCTTGKLLAGLSIVYPFIGEHIYITPNFQTQVLQGDFLIKGKITLVCVVIVGTRLLMDRHVRNTIRDIRNFQL